jgi:hypothetical protein
MEKYINSQLITRGRGMFFLLFFLLFSIKVYSQTYQNSKTKKILTKTYNRFHKMESGQYNYQQLFKYFDSDEDTVVTNGNIWFYYKANKQIDFVEHIHRFLKGNFDYKAINIQQDSLFYTFTKTDNKYRTDSLKNETDYYSDSRSFITNKGGYFIPDSSTTVYYKGKVKLNKKKCFKIEIIYYKDKDPPKT